MEAEAISSDTKRDGGRRGANGPLSPGSSADQDMRELVGTVDKARRAASNAAQVGALVPLTFGSFHGMCGSRLRSGTFPGRFCSGGRRRRLRLPLRLRLRMLGTVM